MNQMFLNMFNPHRQKGAKTGMKSKKCGFNTIYFQPLQQFMCKVKTGRRRSNRTRLTCYDGLIALAVNKAVITLHIRRQRDMAFSLQPGVKRLVPGEFHQPVFRAVARQYNSGHTGLKKNVLSVTKLLRRTEQTFPSFQSGNQTAQQKNFNSSAGRLMSKQPGRYYTRVVHYQQVARTQVSLQVTKLVLSNRP